MRYFTRKGYGRIFTDTEENIMKIKEIIKAMDSDEFGYLPDDLIAVYKGYDEVVYNGKFDSLDLDELTKRCEREGITCRAVVDDNRFTE